jgi:peptide/nickel transport system substrate-binding protein
MKKITFLSILSLSLCAALFGAGRKDGTAQAKHLILAVNPDYVSFDTGVAYEPYGNLVLHPVYDTLVEFKGSLENLVPSVAESWTVGANGLSYTFKLRQGVKFESGNPLTGADVQWSFERAANLKGNGAFLTDNIASIAAPDASTVVLNLNESDPAMLTKLAFVTFSILDSKLLAGHGAVSGADAAKTDTARSWLDSHSAGSGPYRIASYTPNVEVVMDRNANYWGQKPYYDKITLQTVTEPNTQLMMLQAGDVDIAYDLGPEQIKQLQGKSGVAIIDRLSLTASFLLMNRSSEIAGPVADPRVQKAIRAAIDYKGLQALAGSNITPAAPFPIGLAGSVPALDVSKYPDTALAKKLLSDAGYAQGFSTKLYVPTNVVVGVNLVDLAQKIQNDLAQIGVKADLVPEPIMVSFDTYRDGRQPLGLWYWSPDYPDNSSQLAFLPGASVGGVRAKWLETSSPKLAALGKAASTEVDSAKRLRLFKEIQESMIDDSAFAMLLQHSIQYASREGIKGAHYLELYQIDLKAVSE